jgi:hypothetical protein
VPRSERCRKTCCTSNYSRGQRHSDISSGSKHHRPTKQHVLNFVCVCVCKCVYACTHVCVYVCACVCVHARAHVSEVCVSLHEHTVANKCPCVRKSPLQSVTHMGIEGFSRCFCWGCFKEINYRSCVFVVFCCPQNDDLKPDKRSQEVQTQTHKCNSTRMHFKHL